MAEIPLLVMPWHRPDPCKPLKMQTKAAFQKSYIDYLSSLSLDSPSPVVPITTIMCTIGKVSNNVDALVDLIEQGMSIGLVPLSVGVHEDHVNMIANLRAASTSFSLAHNRVYPLGIAVQTKGPGIRIGGLHKDAPIELPQNHTICLSSDPAYRLRGTEHYLYVSLEEICDVLREGDLMVIGHDKVILQVTLVVPEQSLVECKVVSGGVIDSFMTLSLPDVPVLLPPLTEEDKDDLRMAATLGVDIVVATRTQGAEHITNMRSILVDEHNAGNIKVWAQIESKEGMDNLESILDVADAVLFSRISLLQDIPPEKLFLAQKMIIGNCNKAGVPVFVTNHYLSSMEVEKHPTISEMADVATAILDGVDGFLTRRTTSTGKHPAQTVKVLAAMCLEAEAAVWHHQTFSYFSKQDPPPVDPTHAIAIGAVDVSLKTSAAAIILTTTSGHSAQVVARYRPRCPVIAVTRYGQVARQLNTWRAVKPLHYVDPPLPDWHREVDVRIQFGIEYAKLQGIIHPGDCLVLMNGWRQGAGFTNTVRVVYASDSFPWVYPHKLPKDLPEEMETEMVTKATWVTSSATTQGRKMSPSRTEKMRLNEKVISAVPSLTTSSRSGGRDYRSSIKALQDDFKAIADAKHKEISDQSLRSQVGKLKTELMVPENASAGNKSDGNMSAGNKSGGNMSAGNKSGGNMSTGNKSGGNTSTGNKSGGNVSTGNKSEGNKSGSHIIRDVSLDKTESHGSRKTIDKNVEPVAR